MKFQLDIMERRPTWTNGWNHSI